MVETGPILVAMSGGVDSSVTAALLRRQGWQVVGVFMRLGEGQGPERAQAVARQLAIPLEVVDLRQDFARQVLDYFVRSYDRGQTPNPCVVCNRTIKFGLLRQHGRQLGLSRLATGHYARIRHGPDGRARLFTGLDPGKDQSYFLCGLGPTELAGVVLPLGELTKAEVYRLAADLGLSGLHGEESQDVCFLEGRELSTFLAAAGLADRPGDLVTRDGVVRGRHRGVHHFTVGQRRGLGVPDATPFYVAGLEAEANRVILAKADDLWQDALTVTKPSWVGGLEPPLPQGLEVKIRHRHTPARAEVHRQGEDLLVRFATPQRAITPGQFAAFYQGDELLGGGPIR